jgi:hypothetical protein
MGTTKGLVVWAEVLVRTSAIFIVNLLMKKLDGRSLDLSTSLVIFMETGDEVFE